MGVDRGNDKNRRLASSKKPSGAKRKIGRRKINFKDSSWFEAAAQQLSIPLDRRAPRDRT